MLQLELVRTSDCEALLVALGDAGLDARRIDSGDCTVEVEAGEDELTALVAAWIEKHELPLVPTPLGDGVWVIRPPGD